jgi:alpha-glucoside transport system substrate-binding protein
VKSLVWYVPENFEDAGYDVPETMEELIALTEQIVADGETPWCIGLGSGAPPAGPRPTGSRTSCCARSRPRSMTVGVQRDPVQRRACRERHRDLRHVRAQRRLGAGGAGTVATTDFRDSPAGLFASPPECYMHRQASFIPAFFPEGTEVGEDADFFYFPAFASEDLGNPVLGGGTLMAITDSVGCHHGLHRVPADPDRA